MNPDDVDIYEPDPEEIKGMIAAEWAFRETHDLLNDDAWDEYCDAVGEEWLRSQDLEGPVREEPTPRAARADNLPTPSSRVRGSAVPQEARGPHSLTPIEAPFYDALAETGLTFSVQPHIQHADRRYRLDFLIYYDGRGVAVELDGHDYHKTKEQRGYDAERDRWLLARGIRVVRFTGSQVYADAEGCVRELLDVIRQSQARP